MRDRIRPFTRTLFRGLLFLALVPCMSSAAPAPSRTPHAAENPSIPGRESKDWRALINRGLLYLAANEAVIDADERDLPELVPALQKRLIGMEVRFRRLRVLFRLLRKTPTLLFNMEEQIQALEFITQEVLAPIEKMDRNLSAMEQFGEPRRVKQAGDRDMIDKLVPGDVASLMAEFKNRNGALRARASSLREQLAPALEEGRAFQGRLKDFRASVGGETGAVLRDFYPEPTERLVSPAAWRQAFVLLATWVGNFTVIDLTFNQYDNRIWVLILIRASVAALLLVFGAWIVLRRLQARAGVPGLTRALFLPAAWLACGAALALGIGVPYFVRSAFVIMAVWLFLSRGLILLGERLRDRFAPVSPPRVAGHLTPLWLCAAAGNILQSLDLRTESVSLLWTGVLLLLWLALRVGKGSGVARRSLHWIFPLLAACAILGWAHLAVFLATVLMVVCVGAVLAEGVSVVRRRFDASAGAKAPPLAVRIIRETVSPANVFILAVFSGLWGYAVYLGGGPLIRLILGLKIEVRNVTLHLASVPLIVAGYFVTRSVIAIVVDCIPAIRGTGAEDGEGEIISLQVLSRYLIWFVFLMLALSLLGFTMGNLALVAGGLSVGIGFGMQYIINNLVSGILLLLGREIQPGDMIERDGNYSRVEQVTLRNTYLRTYAGKTIIVPNSEFVAKSFSNWTYRDPRIRGNIVVRVAASVDSRTVEELLLTVARANPNVLNFPVPSVRLENFSQGNLEFSLRVWVAHPRDWKVVSDLRHEILRALTARGIAMA